MFTPLPSDVEDLWKEYQASEQICIRPQMLAAMNSFVDSLLQQPEHVWQRWAIEFAQNVTEGGYDFPVRMPLFKKILFPALVGGIERETPGCARWLAKWDQLLYRADLTMLPEHLQNPWGLLEEALRIDPNDRFAREERVRLQARFLEYTLHELPAGVLYGLDGATQSECDELLEGLEIFRSHVAALGEMERFTPLIDDCEFHYTAYREYLRNGRVAGSYAAYLTAKGMGERT